jgi:hypothetical protein
MTRLARYADTYIGGTGEIGYAAGAARTPRGKVGGEGLRAAADGGPDAVRIEALGVTTGWF